MRLAVPASACAIFIAALSTSIAAAQPRIVEIEMVPTKRAQIAVWIERSDGTYLRTLALTQAVAIRGIGNRPGASQMNSGFRWPYGRREGVLPVWAHRRAGAEGAEQFGRVIFQNRHSEGDASRSSNDFSVDNYFCLSFNQATTTHEALDAVTCASTFNSDKGRYLTAGDASSGYAEPSEASAGVGMMRPLELFSFYPPRRDVNRCMTAGCYDHPDVASFASDARRIFPEIDAVSTATQPGGMPLRVPFTFPTEWPDGDYVVWIEVNTEGDYNAQWDDDVYPTPLNPSGTWDYWAMNYGYPYRGQPSVVFRIPFSVGTGAVVETARDAAGYGSLSGQGPDGGALRPMDSTITDNPEVSPGSGVDRLNMTSGGWRARVTVVGPEICEGNAAPGAVGELEISAYHERRSAHKYAHLTFIAPDDDLGVDHYEVRVSHDEIVDELSFMRAQQALAASMEIEALQIPTGDPAGTEIEVDLGGLSAESHYWVAVRAVDRCNTGGPITAVEYTTPQIQFTTVSPCFVATAAYGTPMTGEIAALRRFRDRHLMTNAPGRALVSAYWEVGPSLADWIREDDDRRAVARAMLSPIVALTRALD